MNPFFHSPCTSCTAHGRRYRLERISVPLNKRGDRRSQCRQQCNTIQGCTREISRRGDQFTSLFGTSVESGVRASARHVRSGRPAARPRVCCGLNLFSAAGFHGPARVAHLSRRCTASVSFEIAATSFRRPSFSFLSLFFSFKWPVSSFLRFPFVSPSPCAVFFFFFFVPSLCSSPFVRLSQGAPLSRLFSLPLSSPPPLPSCYSAVFTSASLYSCESLRP